MNFSWGEGGPLFYYCDLGLGPMTFISELDLDMILIYHCAKKKVSILSASKVTARTDTDNNTDMTKTLPLHLRGQ